MKAKFTYFKDSGKWYSQGEGIIPDDFGIKRYTKIEIINLNKGNAPGLNGTGVGFIWLIEGENDVPRLLTNEDVYTNSF